MKLKIILGIIIVIVAILGVAAVFSGEFNIVDTTIVEKVVEDDIPITEEIDVAPVVEEVIDVDLNCMGTAQCFAGTVSRVIDGDTIVVNDESIRFSLSTAPELQGFGGMDSKNFIETICPIGSTVLVDEDDGQVLGSYGRIIAQVNCNDVILNQELLDASLGHLEERFCDSSEFANTSWAEKHGCPAGN